MFESLWGEGGGWERFKPVKPARSLSCRSDRITFVIADAGGLGYVVIACVCMSLTLLLLFEMSENHADL